MTPARRRRPLLLWVLLAVVAWNGLYDVRISLGVREYLLAQALADAGRGPAPAMSAAMAATVRDAVMVASLWAAVILAAGLWTVRAAGWRLADEER